MRDIPKEYLLLFNTITDTGEALRLLQLQLAAAQQQAEALFMEGGEEGPERAAKPA